MPRGPRIKSPDSIFHVMVRSISEIKMFKEKSDKEFYFYLIRKYQQLYKFKVYAYCLMDNHGHLIIDANGADISKIMHGINFTYAQNYNHKHGRRGTLFQDRFKSKIIKDDTYLITLSAYIHNNPRDIEGYDSCPEKYENSSLAVYLGHRKDPNEILDEAFIMQKFGKGKSSARRNYIKFLSKCNEIQMSKEVEFINDKTEYRSERKILVRDMEPEEVIEYVARIAGKSAIGIHVKNNRKTTEVKALSTLLMRSLCSLKCKDICGIFGNITIGRVSKLCSMGLEIMNSNEDYKDIIDRFVRDNAV